MAGIPIAGVVWQHLHYIIGLQRLGHDVYYFEDSARFAYDPTNWQTTPDYAYAIETLSRLGREHGFEGRWCYCARYLHPNEAVGIGLRRMREMYREADAILNICGSQELNSDLLKSDRVLYVESDPGVEQIEIDKGTAASIDKLRRHKALFTFGENVGTPAFPVPNHGFRWIPTRQPVVTDLWKTLIPPQPEARFTSVANWNTSGLKDIEWRGERYLWSKSLEFLKFAEAPQKSGEVFELATNLKDPETRDRLKAFGWSLTDPNAISIDPDAYKRYLQQSKGEFTVAKDQYVRLNTGWFSDRSACYLAAGRPVITQETGFSAHYGCRRGLFGFKTLDEIPEAVKEINADYAAHSKAAFEVAAEYFEASRVLENLLEAAGV